jgi:predicted permease
MFSLMNLLILRPLAYPDKDHLVRVHRTTPQEPEAAVCAADYLELQREAADFIDLAAYRQWGYTMTEPGRAAVQLNALRASPEFFHVLGLAPKLGRTFVADEDQPGNHVIVLSHATWLAHFGGDPNIINRAIQIDGEATTVIGVMPEEFSSLFLWGPADAFRPLALSELEKANRDEASFPLIGRIKSDLSLEQLNARLDTVARRLAETRQSDQADDGLRAETLEASIHSPQAVMLSCMMVALAGFVLLIVCGNLANLQLARAGARVREFAIRAALGASRGHLVRPLLAESMLLAGMGGFGGVLVALWSNQWISSRISADLPIRLELTVDSRVIVFAVVVSLLTGVMFGLVPAWLSSRVQVNDTLKSGSRGSTGDRSQHRFRHTLIVVQFAVALVLLACAGFFIRGLEYLHARDPGWTTAGVTQATISLPPARYATPEQSYSFYTELQERLRALPGVEDATVGWTTPVAQFLVTRNFVVDGREPPPPGREPLAVVNAINPTFLDVLKIDLRSGRNFTEADRLGAAPVVMINQSMAQALFPGETPIGRRLLLPNSATRDTMEIVGVFSDVGLAANPTPPATSFQVFTPFAQECWNYATVAVRSSRPEALIEPMRQTIFELDPNLSPQMLNTVDNLVKIFLRGMQLMTTILTGFGALGLLLASLGLYGVIARLVVQRTPEIGVRLALGAQGRDVLWLVQGSGLRLTLIGAAIGFGLSFLVGLGLNAMTGNDQGVDFLTLAVVTVILVGVAQIASYLPARRAMKISPLEALRAE